MSWKPFKSEGGFVSENKSPNLPPHLREKMEQEITSLGMTYDKNNNPDVFSPWTYEKAYQQAYADILQELGPVVETLRLIAAIHCDYRVFDSETHERLIECIVADTDAAREALKHLKERILTEERNGG